MVPLPFPPGALEGVRVLDLSRVLAGPWCTQTLADLGADVIKVERPGVGDDTRAWGPPFLPDPSQPEGRGTAAYFLACNRNKRSVTIDFAHPRGQAIVRQLAQSADVVVENFKVGDMARYGLDAATLRAHNPGLVYCSITGYGQTGPAAHRAGYDYVVQGQGGLMSITGEPDGAAGGEPQKVGVAVADLFTGMYATVAILAALRHRDRSGEGQDIDMALLDAQVAMLANVGASHLVTGRVPQRLGNAHPAIVPYQVFEVADGHLILAVGNDGQFERFCQVAGHPAWAQDPRFKRNADRVANRVTLVEALEPVMKSRRREDWLQALEAATVPCGPIQNLAEVFEDPQVQARGLRQTVDHPLQPDLPLIGSPLHLSRTPPTLRQAPPELGQHTDEVLAELGFDAAARAELRAQRVI